MSKCNGVTASIKGKVGSNNWTRRTVTDLDQLGNPKELKHSHSKWLTVRWLGTQLPNGNYTYRGKVYKLL